jgi:hypothetical protein
MIGVVKIAFLVNKECFFSHPAEVKYFASQFEVGVEVEV